MVQAVGASDSWRASGDLRTAAAEMRNTSAVGAGTIAALRSVRTDDYDIVVPVRPVQAIYASFRHIQVLPDTRLQDGVPLYKLKILDSLIEELSPGKAGTAVGASGGGAAKAEAVDRIIGDLSGGLRAAEAAAGRGLGSSAYRAGFLPLPGAFVDLVA
jgi:hypothetical protein